MDLNLAIVFAESLLLLWREVLVAEDNYTALGYQQTKFILLFFCQVLELKAFNFRANVGGEIGDLARSREQ